MNNFLDSISENWMAHFARDTFWAWPFLENLHFIGLSALVGGLLVLDLRVIGIGPPKYIPMKPALKLIPLIIIAFSINLITGIFFFCGDPYRYTYNLAFQLKVVFMAIAGANALWFWFGEHAKLNALPDGVDTPMGAKIVAAASLLLWAGVIIMGRLIPYLEGEDLLSLIAILAGFVAVFGLICWVLIRLRPTTA
ncbi:MAG: hypothetical protein LBF16_09685 [Pseudomonadales bacterium]|jgi:hypothetical protein|nr:hypothetical protein [Pseudomonadales bacterium]